MMAKGDGEMAPAPVLAVGLGRGFGGKSTGLSELVWRARDQGRDVIVADGDARSRTLAGMFPEAVSPATDELPDVKEWLSGILNRMVEERRSAVLDLGGGDRVLQEYGRDLLLVEFCGEYGIEPLALYFLGPEEEDLKHVLSIWEAGYYRPKRTFLVMNEGVIREGRTMAGAFGPTLGDPGVAGMIAAGAVPVLMKRLACMDQVRKSGLGFYGAAAGAKGVSGKPLDPTYAFMVRKWLRDLESERVAQAGWLP
ncbi:hypothetical protein SAE02_69780 [Skermanella aerolata]|uniref:CobQ/CobB/MinD/ParA nucleotide binding domain-containing protein n=1 Tax=Skermanella aerolata TaxID=393310 RepID=A0A512E2Y1_9PROT|nr:hypothetical protein [Skermanella aerolata]GEO42830.1 hypothetical protein SAE02_69780 [Skermanella aerolata]